MTKREVIEAVSNKLKLQGKNSGWFKDNRPTLYERAKDLKYVLGNPSEHTRISRDALLTLAEEAGAMNAVYYYAAHWGEDDGIITEDLYDYAREILQRLNGTQYNSNFLRTTKHPLYRKHQRLVTFVNSRSKVGITEEGLQQLVELSDGIVSSKYYIVFPQAELTYEEE